MVSYWALKNFGKNTLSTSTLSIFEVALNGLKEAYNGKDRETSRLQKEVETLQTNNTLLKIEAEKIRCEKKGNTAQAGSMGVWGSKEVEVLKRGMVDADGKGGSGTIREPIRRVQEQDPRKAKKMTIRILDPAERQFITESGLEHIKKCIKKAGLALEAEEITAVLPLRSRDIMLSVQSIQMREELEKRGREWTRCLGTTVKVLRQTFPVMMHGFPKSETEGRDGDGLATLLVQHNQRHLKNPEIIGVTVVRPAKERTAPGGIKKHCSLIIEFPTPEAANDAVVSGMVFYGGLKLVEFYDRTARLRQCFRCQRYGHIAPRCLA